MEGNIYNCIVKRSQTGAISIFLVVLAVILLGGAGYYLYKNTDLFKPIISKITNNNEQESVFDTGKGTDDFDPGEINEPILRFMMRDILTKKNLQIQHSANANFQGCKMTADYLARVFKGNYYSRQSSTNDPATATECQKTDFVDAFFENYWIGDKIYYRHNDFSSFEDRGDNNKIALAAKLDFHLNQLFANIQRLEIKSIRETSAFVEATAFFKNNEFEGEYVFFINKEKRVIDRIQYNGTVKEGGVVDGKVLFLENNDPIVSPFADNPESAKLLDYFNDIFNYKDLFIDVFTQNYLIEIERFYPNIHVLEYGPPAKSRNCLIAAEKCQEKFEDLKLIVSELEILIKDAKTGECKMEDPPPTSREKYYKDKLRVRISNHGRNPDNTLDFLLDVTFDTSVKNAQGGYFGLSVRYGDLLCYDGAIEGEKVKQVIGKLDDFVDTF